MKSLALTLLTLALVVRPAGACQPAAAVAAAPALVTPAATLVTPFVATTAVVAPATVVATPAVVVKGGIGRRAVVRIGGGRRGVRVRVRR